MRRRLQLRGGSVKCLYDLQEKQSGKCFFFSPLVPLILAKMDGAARLCLHPAGSVLKDPRVKRKLLLYLRKDNARHLQLHGVKAASVCFTMRNIVRMCTEKLLQEAAKRDKTRQKQEKKQIHTLGWKIRYAYGSVSPWNIKVPGEYRKQYHFWDTL